MQINHRDLFAPSFFGVWNDLLARKYPEIWLAGGRGSTKSSFISTAIILLMEMNPSWHCVCFRKYGSNLADSVFSQFEFTIKEKLTPLSDHWEFRKSPLKIINVNTGQQILFRGLDDPLKMKSLKPPFGSYSLLWFEELAEFDGIEEIRSVGQSVKRGGHYFQTFCSYNPPETTASWVNYEAQKPQMVDGKEYRHVYHSNYLSVPVQWLGPQFFKEAEILRAENPRAYAHEYLGMVTGNGGAVFPNVRDYRMSDAMIRNFANIRIGCDFGFSLDPSAVTFMNIDMKRRNLFIFDEIYEQGLMNWTLANEIKKRECVGFNYIMCDSAEPKSIAEIESLGINALPTPKGPDSIRFGIKFLQSLKNIFIDKLRAPETFREFTQYEYEKTKSGQFISRFPDHDNHSIDSVRYGVHEDAVDAGFM